MPSERIESSFSSLYFSNKALILDSENDRDSLFVLFNVPDKTEAKVLCFSDFKLELVPPEPIGGNAARNTQVS